MKDFETIEISGDVGLKIFGDTLSILFMNAARGFYSLTTDIGNIQVKRSKTIKISGESLEGLLIAFLNELIFYLDTEGFIGKDVTIHQIKNDFIEATVSGEDFDPNRHEPKLLIKAATYHNISIFKTDGFWTASVIFDI